jgi:ribosome-associated translation inhibitor RaiA
MINQEFQELKKQWGVNSSERVRITEAMRENLTKRNKNNDSYVFNYTQQGVVLSISNCTIEELFAIDGDMNPQGI